jgi:signal recognition particle subunit SRP54
VVLRGLGKSLNSAIEKVIKRGPIDKELIIELKNDIFTSLLEADISIELATQVVQNVENRSFSEKLPPGLERNKAIVNIVYEELTNIMGRTAHKLKLDKKKTNILMTLGIQGSGKTTTIGKLAKYLKKENWNIGLICADTWRPGAYDQLKQLGDRIDIEVYGDPNEKKAVKLATKGIKHFESKEKDLIIVDTAGRHKEESSLINEMKDLANKVKPDEIILVIDGTLGQSAYSQAKAFSEATNIGSIIVTKLDGTAKGGGAISASAATGAPIKFIGLGEDIALLEEFDPKKFVGRILGLGDLESLLDEVKRANIEIDEDRTQEIMKGHMNYNDIITMFSTMNKMGGFRKILDMLPGMTHQVDDNMLNMSKDTMKEYENIISSMTKSEKEARVKLNMTRIDRIARGSGVSTDKVRELINQKKNAEKMVKQMTKPKRKGRGGEMNLPFNMPPFGM